MVYAGADVAYSMRSMLEKKKDLDAGGLDVELITIKGAPHVCPLSLLPGVSCALDADLSALLPIRSSPT